MVGFVKSQLVTVIVIVVVIVVVLLLIIIIWELPLNGPEISK